MLSTKPLTIQTLCESACYVNRPGHWAYDGKTPHNESAPAILIDKEHPRTHSYQTVIS